MKEQRILITEGAGFIGSHLAVSEAYAPGFEDMQPRVPDTSRIQPLIGWNANTKLDDIIRRVARSLESSLHQKDASASAA